MILNISVSNKYISIKQIYTNKKIEITNSKNRNNQEP